MKNGIHGIKNSNDQHCARYMKQFPAKSKIITVVLLAGLFPGLISLAAHWLLGDAQRMQEPLHECLELTGACIALGVGMLLLLRLRHEPTSPHLVWVAAALFAMGLVDGVHGVAHYGVAWSWLRHGATLIGGVLFGLVWLPLPASSVRRKQAIIYVAAGVALAGALGIWWWPQILPAPFLPEGYSFSAKAANALGGLGFLAAALFFIRRYLRQPQTENLVFACHTLLFGTSSLLFGFSHLWAADWWVWHGFRLLAYAIVLVAAYEVVVALYQDIALHARELESRVQARTAELREQREWLRVTLTSIGDAVIATDIAGRVTFLNPVAESLTGWREKEALGQPGRSVLRIINEQTRKPGEDLIARVLREGRVVALANHTALVSRNGREIPIEDSAAPILDASGNVTGVVVVFHDVTQERRAQELVRSAALFPEENPFPVLRVARDGTLLFANRAAAALLAQWQCGVGARAPEYIQGAVRTVLDSGAPQELEICSSDRELALTIVPIGERNYANFYGRDITEHKHAEEKVRHQHAVLNGINRIFREALTGDTEETLGRTCLAVAEAVTGSKFGFLCEINAQGRLDDIAMSDPGWEACQMSANGQRIVPNGLTIHGIYGRVLLDGKGFFTNDPPSHPDSIGTPEGHPPIKAFLGVPLLQDGKTIGMIGVGNRAGGYREEDLHALEALAGPVVQVFLRKRAEKALRENEAETRRQKELLAVTLASIGDAVIATDIQGRVTFLNGEAERLTGWKSAQAVAQPLERIFKIVNEQTRQPVESPVEKALRLGITVGLANHSLLIAKDGRENPIDDSAAPIRQADGTVCGAVLVFRDITERKQAERELRENEERQKVALAVKAERQRFNEVLNMLPAYVILLSPDYRVPFANRYFERQFGKSNGKRCFEYLFNRAEPCENCETFKVLKTNAPHEWEWTGPDGRNYEIHDFPFTDADGSPMIMEMGIDITGRKRAEAALTEANTRLEQRVAERTKALTEAREQLRQHAQTLEKTVQERTAMLQETVGELEHFSYSITHDMRAPLRGLSGYAHLMLTGECGGCNGATSKDFLRRIDKAAQRMDQLITDALQYSKALRAELVLKPVDVAQLLRGMLESYPNLQPPKASIRLEGEFPLVLGNEAALTQCFSNLLGNAVKFVAPGTMPEISIWAERIAGGEKEDGGGRMEEGEERRDKETLEHPTLNIEHRSGTSDPTLNPQPSTLNSYTRLWFEDNGIGIPKESQARIFDMFQRVSKTYEGTGIGLALVRKNAGRMGGKVGVESELGRGSRFWLDLKTANLKIET